MLSFLLREEIQLWSNSLNFFAGILKKRPDAFTLSRLSFILYPFFILPILITGNIL